MSKKFKSKPFRSAKVEVEKHRHLQSITHQPELAFTEESFLLREELRPIRLQLELLKPELTLQDHNIDSTIAFFGSARILRPQVAKNKLQQAEEQLQKSPQDPTLITNVANAQRQDELSRYYTESYKLAKIISENSKEEDGLNLVVTSGGGPGIMEAANRGAHDAGAKSVSLSVVLPQEEESNEFVTPELNFLFHYFAIRKMHFLIRAQALVAFPGGFGTLDEFFEALTLIQTGKIDKIPFLLFGEKFWRNIVNFEALAEEGMISPNDLNLFHYVESAEEAWSIIHRELSTKTANA